MPGDVFVILRFPSRANAEEAVRRLEERSFVTPHVSRLSPPDRPNAALVYVNSASSEAFAFLTDLGCERVRANPDLTDSSLN